MLFFKFIYLWNIKLIFDINTSINIKNKMELALTNFRCWEEKCLSIPSSGICLINGRSGKGKSSILNSILYAVTGKIKNITTINKKSTKVVLKIDNITITRSRGPNRLTLKKDDKIYENDEAQGIINDIFGSEFSNTSYIDQDNIYSFVFLSPSDKMEFLEKLLLNNYNIEKIRDTIRMAISKTKSDYTSEESKINTLESLLDKSISDELVIDKVKVTKLNYEKILDKLISNQEISEKNIKIIKSKIKKLEDEQVAYLKINDKIVNIKMLKDNPVYIEYLEYSNKYNIKDVIISLEESKEYYIKNRELLNLTDKYNELSEKYKKIKDNNQSEIEKLNREKQELESEIKDKTKGISKKRVSELEKCIELVDILASLDDKLKDNRDFDEDIKKEIEILENNKDILTKKQKLLSDIEKFYTCPSCTTTLKISDNKLVLSSSSVNKVDSSVVKQEIESLKSDIKKSESSVYSLKKQQTIYQQTEQQYNDFFDQLDNLRGDIDCDKDYINKEIELILKHIDISKKIQSILEDRICQDIKKDIDLIKSKIDKIQINEIKDIKDEQDYLKCVEKISKLKQFISLDDKIKYLEKEIGDSNIPNKSYQELICSERERLESYITKNDNYNMYIDQIKNWNRIRNMKESIEESSKNKQSLSDRLRCLVKLRDHVKTSEQKCISDFINSLNDHASIYIEQFFPDEDIKVELKTTQETKSTGKEKVALNFELTYRQISGDLSYLSGGERDRVNLAFTLAFSEIINNRILLLDECISSLDAETTNIVLENLKEKYKGKLVILVSHQANLGFFDKVIEI